MLSIDDLKVWIHKPLKRADILLLVLATFDSPCQIRDLQECAAEAGFRIPISWNESNILGRAKGLAIRTPSGWEITDSGKQHLRNLGVTKLSPAAVQVATDLRQALMNISDSDTKHFIEEAVKCYEAELYRSAIVMSWLAAVDVLHKYVYNNHLEDFNTEAKRVDSNWKAAKTPDDIGRMPEGQFLDRLVGISMIGKNVKQELKNCLDRRNGCGHPNSLKISQNTAAHHLEVLILNVFKFFS